MRYNYPGLIDFEMSVSPTKVGGWILRFNILSQDESIWVSHSRPKSREFQFRASNGVTLISRGHPEISGNTLFLMGRSSNDSPSAEKGFTLHSDALQYMDKYILAFEELAQNKGIRRQGVIAEPEQLSLWD